MSDYKITLDDGTTIEAPEMWEAVAMAKEFNDPQQELEDITCAKLRELEMNGQVNEIVGDTVNQYTNE